MEVNEKQLDNLLELTAESVEPNHCRSVGERYLKALRWEKVDRPPLVMQPANGPFFDLPEPWSRFTQYPYNVAFKCPVAMMQNMILSRVVPGILLRDDSPLAIRNDHGTIQIASLLGGNYQLRDNNYPWVEHLDSREALERIAAGAGQVDFASGGVLSPSFETLKFYREKLAAFPPLDKLVQISLPDLQGPLDTAHQLWGSEVFLAFYEDAELLSCLMQRIVDIMLTVATNYSAFTRDNLFPDAITQHGYMIPGKLLIRDDSSIMLSPEMYAEHVRPHDASVLRELGGGAIHFCGDGGHLVKPMLEIPDLLGLDFGESFRMDVPEIYGMCRERRVALTDLAFPRELLVGSALKSEYPTGIVCTYPAKDFNEAREVINRYSDS